ncbi:DUF4129 domain-containing protein [Rufibacter latericius]|uniref:DUF4129 domain-containing protein n=1 Tax=Rufibacter latericius TaxID=2487040 RepID=A0A3M9MUG9_9BACT|nr:DUF4129 domain-containing protein [Rufibacter latericius]RNI28817.1 DUF4129 domain-containing protein [Rufibacter latericius]
MPFNFMPVRFCLLLGFLLFWGGGLRADSLQTKPAATTVSPLKLRYPDPQKLQAYRESKDFQYGQDIRPDMSFWERFWRKVGDYLSELLSGTSYDGFWKYVMYAIAIGTTVFVVLKLLQVDFVGLFSRKSASAAIAYETYRENIHEIDFEVLLSEAEAQGDYRRAIRLYYLQTLKILTDGGLIDWKPGKTNRSYVNELKSATLQKPFERVTQLFEYVWYGGSALDLQKFETVRQSFREFHAFFAKTA